jgi:[methyl-Co(III) methanol-specific corrinoid protein]:coenzyme M methyltransferase
MVCSPSQRFSAALQRGPADSVPVLPLLAGWAARHFSEDSVLGTGSDSDRIAAVQLRAREALDHDGLFAYLDPLYVPEAFGCRIRLSASGLLAEPLLPAPPPTAEAVEALPLPDPRHSGRLPVILAAVKKLADYSQGEIPVIGLFEGPFTTAGRLLETENLLRLIFRNPPVLTRLLDRVTEFLLGFGQALAECGAGVLLLPEPTASSTLISPRMFDQWVLPRLQRIIGNLALPCILHICGDTTPLLPSLVETGARVLSLDQCMNLRESRRGAPRATLGGNVDPVKALWLGSEEAVRQDVFRCLAEAGTEQFVLMSGCSIPPQAPLENLRVMVQTARKFGAGETHQSGGSSPSL